MVNRLRSVMPVRTSSAASSNSAAPSVAIAPGRASTVIANATRPYSTGYAGDASPPVTAMMTWMPATSDSASSRSARSEAAASQNETRCARADGALNCTRRITAVATSASTATATIIIGKLGRGANSAAPSAPPTPTTAHAIAPAAEPSATFMARRIPRRNRTVARERGIGMLALRSTRAWTPPLRASETAIGPLPVVRFTVHARSARRSRRGRPC